MKPTYADGALTTTRKQVIDISLTSLGQHFNIKEHKKSLTHKGTLYMYTL